MLAFLLPEALKIGGEEREEASVYAGHSVQQMIYGSGINLHTSQPNPS